MLKFLVLISFAVIVASEYNIYEILQKIPENQKLDFLKYHISKGKKLTATRIADKINKMFDDYPEEFSIFLYYHAIHHYVIQDEDRLKELREIICFDDGTCIEVGDIGTHP